jgi:hypothetical protein
MRKQSRQRKSPARIRKGTKKQASNLNSARARGIKEALDAVYSTETSELDPFLTLAQQALFKNEEW